MHCGHFSHVQLCTTLWTAAHPPTPWTLAHQAPLSMGFSRQEYWSGLPSLTSRGSSWPRGWTHVSCLLCWHVGSLLLESREKPFLNLSSIFILKFLAYLDLSRSVSTVYCLSCFDQINPFLPVLIYLWLSVDY